MNQLWLSYILALLFSSTSYCYYCWSFARFSCSIIQTSTRPVWFCTIILFSSNFSIFLGCTLLGIGLMLNWLLFIILLFIQMLVLHRCRVIYAIFLSIIGSLINLNSTLLFRSLLALLLNQSLWIFSNQSPSHNLLKALPMVIGFIVSGIIFYILSSDIWSVHIRRMMHIPSNLKFFIQTQSVLLIYLLLHFLFYQIPDTSSFITLWSLFSCIFVALGCYGSLQYSVRLSYLNVLEYKNDTLAQMIIHRRSQQRKLEAVSHHDPLTGLLNRRAAHRAVNAWIQDHLSFTLCLVDLDGLKTVNDIRGHEYGDRYLLTATEHLKSICRSRDDLLFRYGGDEFILLFRNLSADAAEHRMRTLAQAIRADSSVQGFPMQISYGICTASPEITQFHTLFSLADTRMYQMKLSHKKEDPSWERSE